MTDRTDKVEAPRKAMSLPKRPSYDKAIEDIDKWANSPGLQRPN